MKIKHSLRNGVFILLVFILASCHAANLTTPAVFSPSPTLVPSIKFWLAPYIPDGIVTSLHLPENWQLVDSKENANLILTSGNSFTVSHWVFALVAPFPTLTDDVASLDLPTFWKTGAALSIHATKLILSQKMVDLLSAGWGTPATNLVEIQDSSTILDAAWSQKGAWSLIPFEELAPRWKVLSLDGNSPIRKDFVANGYPLSVDFSLNTSDPSIQAYLASLSAETLGGVFPQTNRDPSKLTTVIVTGTTALVRDTARLMEQNGMLFPAENIRDLLREADILHISNEIAFSPTCPRPDPNSPLLVFCSRPEYIQLLEDIGTDVVDMTGDHFIDSSNADVLGTLQMYKDRGWGYYAAGANIEEAREPLLLKNNGNPIAFIGCNAKPSGYSGATATLAGTWHCNWDYLDNEFPLITQAGYQPIMTFSHLEYYHYQAIPELITDFHHAADDGAVIVSGSQGHQPQAMEFYKNSFLHYGLGNLFFDQYNETPDTNKAFIDRHVFYNGKYISTELITIMFIDNAKSRFMTSTERSDLLSTVFQASGWKTFNP